MRGSLKRRSISADPVTLQGASDHPPKSMMHNYFPLFAQNL